MRRVGRVRDLASAVGKNRRGGLRRERELWACGHHGIGSGGETVKR